MFGLLALANNIFFRKKCNESPRHFILVFSNIQTFINSLWRFMLYRKKNDRNSISIYSLLQNYQHHSYLLVHMNFLYSTLDTMKNVTKSLIVSLTSENLFTVVLYCKSAGWHFLSESNYNYYITAATENTITSLSK